MALYGEARDISMFRHINRELMGNIISQQCAFYKFRTDQTNTNIYGESAGAKYYVGPILLYCLISLPDMEFPVSDQGVSFDWKPTFRFLRDDLLGKLQGDNSEPDTFNTTGYKLNDYTDNIYGADLVPQIGDIILYENVYYEVETTNAAQYFVGKNPDYNNNPQPIPGWNPGLEKFGWNTSIICQTHYIPADKVGITLERM
jgi:hypothetical protein